MKNSRRLLLGTFLTLLAVPVAYTGYTRVSGTGAETLPPPQRTPAAELAALRDFTAIAISGDISVEVVAAPDYSIDYRPLSESRGNFTASVEDGTLRIQAFNNRNELASGTVRIGMPELRRFESEFLNALTIRNFDVDTLYVENTVTLAPLVLENNRLDALELNVQRSNEVILRGNSIGTTQVTHFGTTFTTD